MKQNKFLQARMSFKLKQMALVVFSSILGTQMALAATEPAQFPLISPTVKAAPNIFLSYDDSGSMGTNGSNNSVSHTGYYSYNPNATYVSWKDSDNNDYFPCTSSSSSSSSTGLGSSYLPGCPSGLTSLRPADIPVITDPYMDTNPRAPQSPADLPSGSTAAVERDSARTDCVALNQPGMTPPATAGKIWCSAAEERYNFGMWHKYYRYRVIAAKGAMSNVFAFEYPAPIRVGYSAINRDRYSLNNVRPFEGTDKTDFFTWLFDNRASGGTPLKENVTNIGEYFKTSHPWEDSSGQEISCRQSILLIMSDGEASDGKIAPTILGLWNTDLRPALANNVPMVGIDTNQRQHLRTFVVGFGSAGQADQMASAASGRGAYFQANSVSQLVTDLQNVFIEITTAANNPGTYPVIQDKYISATGNKVYTPIYTTGDWTGDLKGSSVSSTGVAGTIKWSAAEQLDAVSDTSSRKIYVNIGGALVAFDSSTIPGYYGASGSLGDYGLNSNMVNYLRGNEISGYRERKSKLGDIVNSRPVYVKEVPNLGYDESRFIGYTAYRAQMKLRAGRVLIGANDGMLHAFDTATGKEVFAFIPTEIIPKLSALADIDYKSDHQYYVDGPLVAADVMEGTTWKNLVIGSLGAGGKSVFALDVTDANNYKLKWEILSKDHADLGFVMQPVQTGYIEVADGHGGTVGKFVGFFGNGPYSANKNAVLFMVDLETGDVSQVTLAQPTVDQPGDHGLMGVTLMKTSQGRVTGLYAGDLKGNLHRVEFKSTGSVSDISGSGPKPALDKFILYTDAAKRPVTAAPVYEKHPLGGKMVYFGTGKFFDAEDMDAVPIVDRVYGIRDKGAPADSDKIATRIFGYNATTKSWVNQDSISYNSNIHEGWTVKLDLPWGVSNKKIEAMRSLFTPTILGDNVIFDLTVATDTNSSGGETCEISSLQKALLAVNRFTGGTPSIYNQDTNNDGVVDDRDIPYSGGLVDGEGGVSSQHGLYDEDSFSSSLCGPNMAKLMSSDGGIICSPATTKSSLELD